MIKSRVMCFLYKCIRFLIHSFVLVSYVCSTKLDTFGGDSVSGADNINLASKMSSGKSLSANLKQSKSFAADDARIYETQDVYQNREKEYISLCPNGVVCSLLGGECITCNVDDVKHNCTYGSPINVTCQVKKEIHCLGNKSFVRNFKCEYCYQTTHWQHDCILSRHCNVRAAPPNNYYTTNCTVKSDVFCLGNRTFSMRVKCNWTSGVRWSTAFILSVTVGGFGVDRFYLGHWREGIGKLFSFGGLGVWTLVDIVLIGIGYISPSDGSLYID